jgi:uncharacterized protein (UPF0297 family)
VPQGSARRRTLWRKCKQLQMRLVKFMDQSNNKKLDQSLGNTQYFKVQPDQETGVKKILSVVYEALSEKGYDPVNQIVGYIMSGDPTYITNYMGARSLIMKVERDELVEEIMNDYIEFNHWKKK